MKKRRKSIMVLGAGPVLTMSALFVILCAFLVTAFFSLRTRDPALAAASLFFALASGVSAFLLLAAYFRHRRDDARREKAWAEMEEKEQRKQ